jgi:hypothetical protein
LEQGDNLRDLEKGKAAEDAWRQTAMRFDGTLKERKEQEERRESQIRDVFVRTGKRLEAAKREKQKRKKTVSELLAMLDINDIAAHALRPANTYQHRSYNLDRQLEGLLNHLFVKYAVPRFLYQVCLRAADDRFRFMHDTYRRWFLVLAQGGSFSKLVRGIMTSREAFLFLQAPAENRVHENIWWARMKAAGLPNTLIGKLIDKIFTFHFVDDPDGRLAETIHFYARCHQEMDRVTFEEIGDFLAWKLTNDRQFRLQGRTVASVIRLSNEWHLMMQKAKLGCDVEWKGMGHAPWLTETRAEVWEVVELRDNRDLMNEGRKQKHCVYSYVHWCVHGSSAIFSLRSYRKAIASVEEDGAIVWDKSTETRRVTIEVHPERGTVAQVRGPLNRMPTDEEKAILRQWAGDKGLIVKVC